jgi:hypothetical protein
MGLPFLSATHYERKFWGGVFKGYGSARVARFARKTALNSCLLNSFPFGPPSFRPPDFTFSVAQLSGN